MKNEPFFLSKVHWARKFSGIRWIIMPGLLSVEALQRVRTTGRAKATWVVLSQAEILLEILQGPSFSLPYVHPERKFPVETEKGIALYEIFS